MNRTELWIGAATNNHCLLGMPETFSGNHASVRFDWGSLRIFDNGSTNKTGVNGEALARVSMAEPGRRSAE